MICHRRSFAFAACWDQRLMQVVMHNAPPFSEYRGFFYFFLDE
jgi:hypothetical protein